METEVKKISWRVYNDIVFGILNNMGLQITDEKTLKEVKELIKYKCKGDVVCFPYWFAQQTFFSKPEETNE